MPFARIYQCYIAKAEKKNRTALEVDQIVTFISGYSRTQIENMQSNDLSLADFFAQAPRLHPRLESVTGVICGYRLETMEPGLMKQIRVLDKLIDELAKGKSVDEIKKILN